MYLSAEEKEVAAGHDVSRALAKGVLALVVQVRVPLEVYQVVVHRRLAERVRHPLIRASVV